MDTPFGRRLRAPLAASRTWTAVVDGLEITVTAKPVRHLRLVVHPDGRVRASVPLRATRRTVDDFLGQRAAWAKAQRDRMLAIQARQLTDGSTIRLWGDEIPLMVAQGRGGGRLTANGFRVSVTDPTDTTSIAAAIDALHRREARAVLHELVEKWAAELDAYPARVTLRAMRTRWGSCTPSTKAIRINPELASHHPRCLSYVVLHEIAHLIEPGHGPGFIAIMDAHLPSWRAIRAELRRSNPA
ncbi:MAG: M48 family metallopeptidase [Propionibacteriaceae bacterium]|nr:M48 family metallopeptidase [Propionibacteriaceae bacterium]